MKFFVWYISCLSFSLSMIIAWWFQNASLIDAFSSCDAWMMLQPATINCRYIGEGGCGDATVKAVVPQIWPFYSSAWSQVVIWLQNVTEEISEKSQAGTVLSFCHSQPEPCWKSLCDVITIEESKLMLCRHDAVHVATVRAVVICFSADLMLSVIVLLFSSQTLQSDVQNRKPCSDSQANCFQKGLK